MFNRWIIGYSIFLIVFSVACYVWYRQDIASYKQEAAKTAVIARQWEIEKPKSRSTAEIVSPQAPADSTPQTAEKLITETPVPKEIKSTQAPNENSVSANPVKLTEDIPMSPFGFGAYPEVPDALKAKFIPVWFADGWDTNPRKNAELLDRVMIKAWNEGKHWKGGSIDDASGKIYLNLPGFVYVWYDYYTDPTDGTKHRYITHASGADLTQQQMHSGILPVGLTALDGETSGIDPYEYLNISR